MAAEPSFDTPTTEPIQWPANLPPIWGGVPRTTLPAFLARCLGCSDDSAAVVFDDGFELSFSELRERIERFAGYLCNQIDPGDRVGLAVGNRAEYLVAYFGTIAARGVMVTLSPTSGSHDAAHVLQDSGCVLVVAEGAAAETIAALELPSVREVIRVGTNEPDGLAQVYAGAERLALSEVDADVSEIVDIGYTSGTTGMPKALAGDHLELLRYVDVQARIRPLRRRDRVLAPLQFHYGDPLYLCLSSWLVGAPIVVMRKFSVSRFFDVARTFGATIIYSIGSIPNLLLTPPRSPHDRAHKIRYANAVGVPKRQHKELNDRFGFPWYETYGSSEAGPALGMPHDVADEFVGTGAIGIPYPDVEARLVDPDGDVVEGPGEGELELSGEILFRGYVNNAEATAGSLHDGWYRTGDLLSRDDRGMYYFLGRRKELIRRGGENIAPAEVEAVLRLHDAVIDAAVVPVEDEIRGEEVLAHVQVRKQDPELAGELAAFCTARLAPFKVPRYVSLRLDPFPRTPSERIRKELLKRNGKHRPDGAWDRLASGKAEAVAEEKKEGP